jgi:hypothetical protein
MVLVRKRTIATERSPHVGEVSSNFCGWRMSRGQRNGSPRPLISIFYTRSRYFSIQVTRQLSSRGWVDPVPDTLLRKSGSTGNRARELWICSHELWPVDHRGKNLYYFCQSIIKSGQYRHILAKPATIKFNTNPFRDYLVITDRQTLRVCCNGRPWPNLAHGCIGTAPFKIGGSPRNFPVSSRLAKLIWT